MSIIIELNFDVDKVFQERLAASMGLDKYSYIMQQSRIVNVATDTDFQRVFNGFYVVRRNESWRKVYYNYFEDIKKLTPTFSDIITYLYEYTGNIEPSFSSKMFATIFPDEPIWDRYVLQNLNIKVEGRSNEEKLKNTINAYYDIQKWYEDFMNTNTSAKCVAAFNNALPNYKWISDIKKIDFILWSIR